MERGVDREFIHTCSLWTFILTLVPIFSSLVEGQPQVIGSSQPIIAAPGDDVILPCHLEPAVDARGLTVEWSRPDLKPDPSDRWSWVRYVHLYRDRRDDLDMKIPSYIRRTTLFTDDMKHGNISLKVMNITSEDEGRFKCFIPNLKSTVKFSFVQLVVDPNLFTTEMPLDPRNVRTPGPDSQTRLGIWILGVVGCIMPCLAVTVGGYFIIRRRQKQVGEEFTSSQGVSFEGTLTVEDGGIVHLPPLDLFEDSNQQHHQSQVDSQDQQE
ncbi:butyrophilin subfamily 2 member A2 [Lates calcarifer]|uniref:Butyrophilin subfamily 2 member A2 n=1 Tax=Lates calcarifer TaxID=8187 RepID=A0AAJ7PXK9_LATCA|nr:butyrophilin subfamily 2 member A2 [Lates calcarifer]